MANRLSQAQREALERQDAHFLALPLQHGFDNGALLAHLRHTARLLKDRQAASPSARAVTHINALYDRSIPAAALAAVACRAGCNHCCHQPVLVYGPEAFFLAGQIRNQPGAAQLVAAAEAASRGLGLEGRKWVTCPLLKDNACTVYAARPLSCHSFFSLDVNDCIGALRYHNPLSLRPPVIRSPAICDDLRNDCRLILLAAMKALGLPVIPYELTSAVSAILAQDNAEKRWLRGEDVLAGVRIDAPPLPPESQTAIATMAAGIAAML